MTKKLMIICSALLLTIASCTKAPIVDTTKNTPETSAKKDGSKGNSGNSDNNKGTNDNGKPPVDTSDRGGDENPRNPECEGIYCTQEFRMIDLQVKDASGNTVVLTSFHTEDMAGNKLPAHLYEYDAIRDAYVVFNDAWVNGHENTTTQVRFVGYKNGNKVVNEVYDINTDCCHITKTSGKDAVVLP